MNITNTPKNDSFSWVDEVTTKDYEEVLNSFEQGICIISITGRIVFINSAYEKIFSMNDFIVRGRSIFNTVKDELLLKAYREKKKCSGLVKYSGRTEKINGTAFPYFKNGEYKGIIGVYELEESNEHEVKLLKNLTLDENLQNPFKEVIGTSDSMIQQMKIAQKVAKTDTTVLIRGESGTGKEVVARAIHKYGNRSDKPFVAVNCGAIPINLIESELFGFEKGAFTGAVSQKIGKFELANNGIIFLDEIGDLPLEVQVKLLRVIQEKNFERVGGNESIKVNVRILAATHKNLEQMISEGSFREDLYYRINIIPIQLDALRERKEDIPLLVEYFMEKTQKRLGFENYVLTEKAMDALMQYDWPGNVRELENILERIIILSDSNIIDFKDLPSYIANAYDYCPKNVENTGLINLNTQGNLALWECYEKEIIEKALLKHKSFNKAGKALGLTHNTVAAKVKKYGL